MNPNAANPRPMNFTSFANNSRYSVLPDSSSATPNGSLTA